MKAIKRYTCVFFFDPEMKHVKLLSKKFPENYGGAGRMEWQDGAINGIGGLILEDDTSVEEAMSRKFKDETGVDVAQDRWTPFCHLNYDGGVVFFAWGVAESVEEFSAVKGQKDEEVVVVPVARLGEFPVIWNLRWLIPMALDKKHHYGEVIDASARYNYADVIPAILMAKEHVAEQSIPAREGEHDASGDAVAAGPGTAPDTPATQESAEGVNQE